MREQPRLSVYWATSIAQSGTATIVSESRLSRSMRGPPRALKTPRKSFFTFSSLTRHPFILPFPFNTPPLHTPPILITFDQ